MYNNAIDVEKKKERTFELLSYELRNKAHDLG